MIKISYFKNPYGELIIGDYQGKLCLCDWRYRKTRSKIDDRIQNFFNTVYIEQNSFLIEKTINQLTEYFKNQRTFFHLPLIFAGNNFQKIVWNELLNIPYGKTLSYIDLAQKIGNKKAVRAVATANGANAISIIIPCHRVLGSKGELTGYAGGLSVKMKLLNLESPQLKLF